MYPLSNGQPARNVLQEVLAHEYLVSFSRTRGRTHIADSKRGIGKKWGISQEI